VKKEKNELDRQRIVDSKEGGNGGKHMKIVKTYKGERYEQRQRLLLQQLKRKEFQAIR